MRKTTLAAFVTVALTASFVTPTLDTAHAVNGDEIARAISKTINRRFGALVKRHKLLVSDHKKFFSQQTKTIVQNLKSSDPDVLLIFFQTENALQQTFSQTTNDTRGMIASLASIVLEFYDDNPTALDAVPELSGDMDSLLGEAIERLNRNNDKVLAAVRKASGKIEKTARKNDVLMDIDLFDFPQFVAPQFDRNNQASSGATRNRLEYLFLTDFTFEGNRVITGTGYTGYESLDGDDIWAGVFDADNSEIDRMQPSRQPDGLFQSVFSGLDCDPKITAFEIEESEIDTSLIFADGFESGDVSAWSSGR